MDGELACGITIYSAVENTANSTRLSVIDRALVKSKIPQFLALYRKQI